MAKNIHQRLAAAMGSVRYVQKERKQGMRYSIVSHDAVTSLCRPVLLENGIVYYPVKTTPSQVGNRAECHMVMRFVNVDEPSDFIDVETFGHGIDDQDKGPGKAMSYAAKYALLKTLGLETGDDPELEQDVRHSDRVPDDRGVSEASYLETAYRAIDLAEGTDTLKTWWANQKAEREKLGIVNGSPNYKGLFEAFRSRGAELQGKAA